MPSRSSKAPSSRTRRSARNRSPRANTPAGDSISPGGNTAAAVEPAPSPGDLAAFPELRSPAPSPGRQLATVPTPDPGAAPVETDAPTGPAATLSPVDGATDTVPAGRKGDRLEQHLVQVVTDISQQQPTPEMQADTANGGSATVVEEGMS